MWGSCFNTINSSNPSKWNVCPFASVLFRLFVHSLILFLFFLVLAFNFIHSLIFYNFAYHGVLCGDQRTTLWSWSWLPPSAFAGFLGWISVFGLARTAPLSTEPSSHTLPFFESGFCCIIQADLELACWPNCGISTHNL